MNILSTTAHFNLKGFPFAVVDKAIDKVLSS